MNRMEILGRSGYDPILKYTPNGMAILELSLADNRRNKDGTYKTQWFKVIAFGKLAESMVEVIKKGTEVWASGEYERREVKTESGIKYFEQLNASYVRACIRGKELVDQGDDIL